MIGPCDIKRWAESRYPDFLRSLITGEPFFPLRRDRLGQADASLDATAFNALVRPLWDASKNETNRGYTVLLERRSRRSRGVQNEPVAILVETREDYHAIVGRRAESTAFEHDAAAILAAFPTAKAAILRDPLMVVEYAGDWHGVIEVCRYLQFHPRPGCFVRALPVSVHTKFIETHAGAIEALCAAIPETGFVPGEVDFAARCGFKSAQPYVAGRFLCPDLQRRCGMPVAEMSMPTVSWNSLPVPDGAAVIVCENKANFLSLPQTPNSLAIWGQGGAAEGLLESITWLQRSAVIYWGDIDPCGFAILSRLRRALPHSQSILMDKNTVERFAEYLMPAKTPPGGLNIEMLTQEERAALGEISNPPRGIEQEKILFSAAMEALQRALLR